MLLSDMKPGDRCIIENINIDNSIKRRLLDLGIVKGTLVECLYESMFKSPVAYLVRDTVIAIRKKDSCNIQVNLV